MKNLVKLESTKAKAAFAKLPARAASSDVAITRHGRIQAYVLSPDRYTSLVSVAEVGADPLRKLEDEFKALVEGMQKPAHRRAVHELGTLPLGEILRIGAGGRSAGIRPTRRATGSARKVRKTR